MLIARFSQFVCSPDKIIVPCLCCLPVYVVLISLLSLFAVDLVQVGVLVFAKF